MVYAIPVFGGFVIVCRSFFRFFSGFFTLSSFLPGCSLAMPTFFI